MNLDVRLPIGGMFFLLGLLLVIAGVVSDDTIYERSLGINVNLWWGMVLMVFGTVMLLLAVRARRRGGPGDAGPDATG